LSANTEKEKYGLLIYQNETQFDFLCQSTLDQQPVIQLYRSAAKSGEEPLLLASRKLKKGKELQLRIEAKKDTYSFYYAEPGDQWTLLKDNADGKFLSTKTAGGFVGCMFALYATSTGQPTKNTASFHRFTYKGNDEVFR